MKPVRGLFVLAAMGLLLGACATSIVLREWKDPAYSGPPFKKVAVMMLSEDVTERRLFEDVIARRLAAQGVRAKTSYGSIPTPKAMECEKVEKMVCDIGAQGVLVTRIVKQETRYDSMLASQPNMFRGYLTSYSMEPTAIRYDVVTIESKLFHMPDGALVWSGRTETIDRPNQEKEVGDFAQQVIKALVAEHLLKGAQQGG